ncbi:MAG: hypothetical protein ACTSU2_09480 [Promethearchaeota archaeon]
MLFDVAAKFSEWCDLRFLIVGIEASIVGFCAFYSAVFFAKAKMRKEYELRNDMAKNWMIFFLTQAIMNAIYIYADFFQPYIPNILSRDYINNLGSVIGMIGLILIAKEAEDILETKYIATITLSIISVFPVFFFYFPVVYFNYFIFIAYISIIVLFYGAVRFEIGNHPLLNKQLYFFVFGFILMASSQLFRSDAILTWIYTINTDWVYNVRFLADWGLLGSLFILQYVFNEFPSLFELSWRKHLRELHFVHMGSGNEILSYYFTEEKKDTSEIIGGFMYGVNQLIGEITGSDKPLNMIKQKENVIVFDKNDKIIIFLIADEYSEIYKLKLSQLLNYITINYGHLLENWDGERTRFYPIKEYIKKIFK